MSSKKSEPGTVRVFAKTIFTERSYDYSGGPGYSGAPAMRQLPGSAANRRKLATSSRRAA